MISYMCLQETDLFNNKSAEIFFVFGYFLILNVGVVYPVLIFMSIQITHCKTRIKFNIYGSNLVNSILLISVNNMESNFETKKLIAKKTLKTNRLIK